MHWTKIPQGTILTEMVRHGIWDWCIMVSVQQDYKWRRLSYNSKLANQIENIWKIINSDNGLLPVQYQTIALTWWHIVNSSLRINFRDILDEKQKLSIEWRCILKSHLEKDGHLFHP